MTRMTIRLPDSLHNMMQQQATREGLSLNQFILYSLTRQSAFNYAVAALPADQALAEHARFQALLKSLGPEMSDEEWQTFLSERDNAPRRAGVSIETENKLRQKIAQTR
ncbi:MAG: type II toxin-antitoxin system HicB family antitoxin [Chloroflexi bacterium]|nr:type II toxin-antitoxin system HicB family antitoxin [Chloroflexota bacterium]